MEFKIEEPDKKIGQEIKANWDCVAKPLDGLGQFETMFAQIGAITGSSSLSIEKKVILTMCADNGLSHRGSAAAGLQRQTVCRTAKCKRRPVWQSP